MTEKRMKAAVIGDKNDVTFYGAAGVAVFDFDGSVTLSKMISKLDNEDYGIIFIAESLFRSNEEQLKTYLEKTYPILIPVPDKDSDGSYAKSRIAANVKKAVGSDLL